MKNEKGQSTIEFITTFSAALGFVFLFLRMAINYTNGYMVHHATYMAARAFLVADSESQQKPEGRDQAALKQAQAVFKKYLPEGLIAGFDGELKANLPDSTKFYPFVGLYVKFTQPFSMGMIGGKEKLDLRSEAFLGREPSRPDSYAQTCNAVKNLTGPSCDVLATLDDNGG
jgi:hypothetical protein